MAKLDTSHLTYPVLANLEHSIRELLFIPESAFDEIYDLAVRAITAEGDLATLSAGIMAMNLPDVSKKRAARVSTLLKLGITHAKWMYSHAPCMIPSHPSSGDVRQDAQHKAANQTVYPIAIGLFLNGRYTWPGYDYGCRCSSRPVIPIPGFDE